MEPFGSSPFIIRDSLPSPFKPEIWREVHMDASLASLDHGPLLQLEDLCLEGLIIHSLNST